MNAIIKEKIAHWKNKIKKTGIQSIDKHHLKFIDLYEHFSMMQEKKSCVEEITSLFYKLSFHVENYFLEEEIYLKQYNYPKLQEHQEAHNAFIQRILYFQREYQAGNTDICFPIIEYLEEWFDEHIIQSDNEAVDFLLQHDAK